MGIKQYLKQAFTIDRLIKAKITHIQHLQDKLDWVGSLPTTTKVQQTSPKDKMGDTVAALLDAITETKTDIKRLTELQKDITTMIARIENTDLQLVLYERYINFKKWEDIAVDNNYSIRAVYNLHGKALREIKSVQ